MADKNDKNDIESKIAEGIAKALPAAVEALARVQQEYAKQAKDDAVKAAKDALPKFVAGELCPECRQQRRACKGEHRYVAVYPHNQRYAKHWDGVGINGVWYRSQNRWHKIAVPADCDIENKIAVWEHEEDQLRTGRESMHDSGEIGMKSSRVNTSPRGVRG